MEKGFKQLIVISKDLYNNTEYSKAESLLTEVQKMLYVLIKNLEQKS